MTIKEAIKNKGVSQKYVAVSIGVSCPTVSEWCSGKKFPSMKHLDALSKLLGCKITDFTFGENESSIKKEPLTESERLDARLLEILKKANGAGEDTISLLCDLADQVLKRQGK